MKKITKISTKIKVLGLLLVFLMISVILTTIYLNQQNTKDALTINIAGKQRMLTQQMAKNIFYINYSHGQDFYELNSAVDEFMEGLNILRHGDNEKGIPSAPTVQISNKLVDINKLWKNYYENIQNFKLYLNSKEDKEIKIKEVLSLIYKENTQLLDNVDKLVSMYTEYSEKKSNFIKTFQYSSGFIVLLLFLYSILHLRSIEQGVEDLMKYSKMIAHNDSNKLEPLKVKAESESEIIEVSDTINCFIQKINSAVDYSAEALLQSERASNKLEELTDEFDIILDEIKDKSLVYKHLNNSEDIVIASTEELINSTRKLQNLKAELDKLAKSCQTNNK